MMLLAGLGNPGAQYTQTRHNVGWQFLDYIAHRYGALPFEMKSRFEAKITGANIVGVKATLLKPLTYMNNSGRSISKWMRFYDILPSQIIVIHDDLDIAFGEFKMHMGRGPKIHNGLTSIEKSLGSKDFMRIRIGIDTRMNKEDNEGAKVAGKQYVLENMTESELKRLETDVFPTIATLLEKQIVLL